MKFYKFYTWSNTNKPKDNSRRFFTFTFRKFNGPAKPRASNGTTHSSPKLKLFSEKSVFGVLFRSLEFFLSFQLLRQCFFDFSMVVGPSMTPLIKPKGDILVLQKFTRRVLGRRYRRGQIIVCLSPINQDVKLCKRVIAVGGDTVISDSEATPQKWREQSSSHLKSADEKGKIDKNSAEEIDKNSAGKNDKNSAGKNDAGLECTDIDALIQPGEESFTKKGTPPSATTQTLFIRVPEHHLWIEGDNAALSFDSRHFGPVSEDLILGHVLFRIWPPWRLRWLSGPPFSGDKTHVVQTRKPSEAM